MGEQLYAAVVTSVPFLLLALVTQTQVFGPGSQGKHRSHRRGEAVVDAFMLVSLATAFYASLWGLTAHDAPDLRGVAAAGLALGVLAAFLHAAGRVWLLYQSGVSASSADRA